MAEEQKPSTGAGSPPARPKASGVGTFIAFVLGIALGYGLWQAVAWYQQQGGEGTIRVTVDGQQAVVKYLEGEAGGLLEKAKEELTKKNFGTAGDMLDQASTMIAKAAQVVGEDRGQQMRELADDIRAAQGSVEKMGEDSVAAVDKVLSKLGRKTTAEGTPSGATMPAPSSPTGSAEQPAPTTPGAPSSESGPAGAGPAATPPSPGPTGTEATPNPAGSSEKTPEAMPPQHNP